MNLLEFVRMGERITKLYQEKGATWNPFEAIAHAHAELSEVWEVLRNKNKKFGAVYDKEWYDKLAEEVADSVISSLIAWEVVPGTTSQQLADVIEKKINIVYGRAMK